MVTIVLHSKPDLAIFGASMAGACVGFLLHNRYRASVFMGDTGSLALGGALAAMAACTGMFFPLFISSGIFVMEASSVIIQVCYAGVLFSSIPGTKFSINHWNFRLQASSTALTTFYPFHHCSTCQFYSMVYAVTFIRPEEKNNSIIKLQLVGKRIHVAYPNYLG